MLTTVVEIQSKNAMHLSVQTSVSILVSLRSARSAAKEAHITSQNATQCAIPLPCLAPWFTQHRLRFISDWSPVYMRTLRCACSGFTVCFKHPLRILWSTPDESGAPRSDNTPPSNDPAETLPRQGKRMTRQESVFPRQV